MEVKWWKISFPSQGLLRMQIFYFHLLLWSRNSRRLKRNSIKIQLFVKNFLHYSNDCLQKIQVGGLSFSVALEYIQIGFVGSLFAYFDLHYLVF
ncbi:MAG: hypothetical protein A2486_09360 [Burkholderiales bacterium RIFOXYC12_FULL_65_23]|nr:MAG: hypothetical protein A2486_09360 [Burkholderiales bacterium RIFOXYC12_FULL_65_23]